MKRSIIIALFAGLLMTQYASADATNVWHFTNQNEYTLSDISLVRIATTNTGYAELVLQAKDLYRTMSSEYTNSSAITNLMIGPDAVIRLTGTPGSYASSASLISRVFDGISNNTWKSMGVLCSATSFKNANTNLELSAGTSNLMALYHLNGNWVDAKSGSNAIPSTPAPTFTSDAIFGQNAVLFLGGGYSVQTIGNNLLNGKTEMTVSCWTKIDSFTVAGGLVSYRGSVHSGLSQSATNKFQIWVNSIAAAQVVAKTSFNTGEWYFVVGTWKAPNQTKLYINGVLNNETNGNVGASINQNDYFRIGWDDGGGYTKGIVDEVAIFDRALSPEEIWGLYRSGESVRFRIRTGNTLPPVGNFVGTDGTSSSYFMPGKYNLSSVGAIDVSNQYLQYKIDIYSDAFNNRTPYFESFYLYGDNVEYTDNGLLDFLASSSNNSVYISPASEINAGLSCSVNYNGGYYTNAEYISRIFDASAPEYWKILAWDYTDELPTNIYGLAGLWHMNDSWNDALNIHNVSPVSYGYSYNSKIGYKSGSFNGTANHTDGFGSLGKIYTVEFWIKSDKPNCNVMNLTSGGAFLYITNNWILASGLTASNKPTVYVNGTRASSKLLNGWNHVALVLEKPISLDSLDVGRAGGKYFKGLMDELAIYNRALASGEISEHFIRGMRHVAGNIKFQVRAGDDTNNLGDFVGYDGTTSTYFETPPPVGSDNLNFLPSRQYFQYKAYLSSDGSGTPIARYVDVTSQTKNWRDDSRDEFNAGVYGTNSVLTNSARFCGDVMESVNLAGPGPANIPSTAQGIIGLYHFDETNWSGAGQVFATVPLGMNCNANGAYPVTDSAVGSASGYFDGINDYIDLNSITTIGGNDFSVGCWFKTTNTTRSAIISSYNGNQYFTIEMNGNGTNNLPGRITFTIDDENLPLPGESVMSVIGGLNDGYWHNVVAVRNGTQILIYVDGVLSGARVISNLSSLGASVTPAVAKWGSQSIYYQGQIDEVSIFKRALTEAEIGTYMAGGAKANVTGTYTSDILDNTRPGIWQTLFWTTDGPYGKRLSKTDTNLVALWSMEDSAGVSISNTVNGAGAGVNGSPLFSQTGRFGKCLDFNGSSDYITNVTAAYLEPGNITVEAWVNMDSVDNRPVADKSNGSNNGYVLATDSAGVPYFQVDDQVCMGVIPVRKYKWTHLAGSYNGTLLKLYVDGELVSEFQPMSGVTPASGQDLYIGRNASGSSYFDGKMDEVAIHNKALSDPEMLDHYKAGAVTMKFQAKSGTSLANIAALPFIGPDLTTNTFFTVAEGDDMQSSIPLGQFFQFKAYMGTENHRLWPKLNGVKVFVSSYPVTGPDVQPKESMGYTFLGNLIDFTNKITTNVNTAVSYQIAKDAGTNVTTWYWHNGTQWAPATLSSHTNTQQEIAQNIKSFYSQLCPNTGGLFRFRTALQSAGDQQMSVDSVSLVASEGRVVVTAPNGTENGDLAWVSDVPYNITWSWAGTVGANLDVEYSLTGTNGPWFTVPGSPAPKGGGGIGYLTWRTPSNGLATNCFVRVKDPVDTTIRDLSDEAFSIIRRFKVTAPSGGETWYAGSTTNITWESPYSVSFFVEIDYAPDGTNYDPGLRISALANNLSSVKTNIFPWSIPTTGYLSKNAKIRIQTAGAGEYTDESDNTFTLAGVEINRPLASQRIQRNEAYSIEWNSVGAGANVAIDFSADGGLNYTNLYASVPNQDGITNYIWNVSQDGTDHAKLRIRSLSDTNVVGYSPEFILAIIDVTAPDGNEIWLMNTVSNITWISGGAGPAVSLYYSTNQNAAPWTPIALSVTNSGSYAWTIPLYVSKYARVKVVSDSDTGLFSVSATNFNIAGARIIFPNLASDIIDKGVTVTNLHNEAPEDWDPSGVKLEISYDEANTFSLLGAGANAWSFSAPFAFVPTYPSVKAKVRATINDATPYTNVFDLSDQYFTVAGILITEPTNNAVFTIGNTYQIKWVSAGASNLAYIYYSNQGSNNFVNLTASGVGNNQVYPGLNPYNWSISPLLLPSTNATIKVVAGRYSHISSVFTLRGIRITSPTNSQIWNAWTDGAIAWTKAGLAPDAQASFALSVDGGVTFPYDITNSYPVAPGAIPWTSHPYYNPCTNAIIRMKVVSSSIPDDTNIVAYSDPFMLRGVKVTSPAAGNTWQMGMTNTITFVSAGAGSLANITYSQNGGVSYEATPVVSGLSIVDGTNNYPWLVEFSRPPSTNAMLKVAGNLYSGYSKTFTVGGVKVDRPFQFDIWAAGETNLIQWMSVGTHGTNFIELIYNGTAYPNYTITNGYVGGTTLNWLVDSNAIPGSLSSITNVVLHIVDTCGYEAMSQPFKMVSTPRVEILAPAAGEFWKVGETREIQWLKGGQMNETQFKVFYSRDNFTNIAGEVLNAISFNPSNNLYSVNWTVPDLVGPMKVMVTNTFNAIVKDVCGQFDVCGNFKIYFPNGDAGEPEIYALSTNTVVLSIRGASGPIDLYYKYSTNQWTKINSTAIPYGGAGLSENYLLYDWTAPNIQSTTVRIRAQDADYTNIFDGVTPGPYDDSGNDFEVKYYNIYWDIYYVDKFGMTNRMSKLSVTDSSGWSTSSVSTVSGPVLHKYPYGVYDTAWYREFFHDRVDFHWICNSNNQLRSLEMKAAEVEPEYHVLANFTYDISNRIFRIHSWLERNGTILPTPTRCGITIYNVLGEALTNVVSTASDNNGVFWQQWNVTATELARGEVYTSDDLFFAKVEIEFSGASYSAGLTFVLRLPAGEEQVALIEGIIRASESNIVASIDTVNTNLNAVGSNVSAVAATLNAFRTDMSTATSNILSVAQATRDDIAVLSTNVGAITNVIVPQLTGISNSIAVIEPAVTNISAKMTNIVEDTVSSLAHILTRPTTVMFGSTNSIIYKSRRNYGAAVTITVSNSTQGIVYSGNMAEVIGGIYQSDLICNWGTNSYTIKCADPYPAYDSMVINISGDNADATPSMISSISNRITGIELQLTNIQAAVSSVTGVDMSGVLAGINSVSNQIKGIDFSQLSQQMTEVKNSIGGINIPKSEAVDLSALTRIEEQLGSLTESDSQTTFISKIDNIEKRLSSVGGVASDAAKKAQSAKSEAAKASGGISALKTDVSKGNIDGETALSRLEEIRKSVLTAQDNIKDIPKFVKLGQLYDAIETMAQTIKELADREGFKNFDWTKLKSGKESTAVTAGEGKPDDAIKGIYTNIEAFKGDMQFLKQLLDEKKATVVDELVGE